MNERERVGTRRSMPGRLTAVVLLGLAVAALALPAAASAGTTASFSSTGGLTTNDGLAGCLADDPFDPHPQYPDGQALQVEATPYPSHINVLGSAQRAPDAVITDVNVTLTGLTHPSSTDRLRVQLLHDDAGALLLDGDGSGGADDVTLTFDDAASQLPDGPLTGGRYKPTQKDLCPFDLPEYSGLFHVVGERFPLHGFNTTPSSFFSGDWPSPAGDWQLYVDEQTDISFFPEPLFGGNSIDGWSLEITSNAPPLTRSDGYTHFGSDTPLEVPSQVGVLANDRDPDGDTFNAATGQLPPGWSDLPPRFDLTAPSHGSVILNPDGSFRYQPDDGYVGSDSFTYLAIDESGNSSLPSRPGTVSITVVGAGCNGQPATITGTGAADKLKGTDGDDVIVGLGGGDTIDAGGGNDSVCGGPGNDSIDGGSGNDRADGGSGDDRVNGGSGNDTLLGGADLDVVAGGAGNDSLSGGLGEPDSCKGDSGTDTLAANHGCEQIKDVP